MEMRPEAERYCLLIETASSLSREEFASEVVSALSDLLSAVVRMPEAAPLSESDVSFGPTQEQWIERHASVRQTLGAWDAYWTTLAPAGDDAEQAVEASLSDDLADIWRDAKEGLLALDNGVDPSDVMWEWRHGFRTHWGRHATEAVRAVQARLAASGN